MSNKKEAQGIKHKSLIHVLEDCVLALESQGQTEQDIFSLVNMILRGFIVNGELTQEYIDLANKAMAFREQANTRTIIAGPDGNPLM